VPGDGCSLKAKRVGINNTYRNSVVCDSLYFLSTYRISQQDVLVKTILLIRISGKYLREYNYAFRCYNEVDKFLSPVLLVFFLGNQAMVCLTAFQLALVSLITIKILKFTNKKRASCIRIPHNLALCTKWQQYFTWRQQWMLINDLGNFLLHQYSVNIEINLLKKL
jgi:hypothetical protein